MTSQFTNRDMAQVWDGPAGSFWASNEGYFERALAPFQERLLEAANIHATDNVMDIGCGNGSTTRSAARMAANGFAHGFDLSSEMLRNARQLADAEGVANINFTQADVQTYNFPPQSFDIAVSRFGSMFFSDPDSAFRNVAQALRTDGRLAIIVWRQREDVSFFNEMSEIYARYAGLSPAPENAPGPFGLSDPDRLQRILEAAAFVDIRIHPFEALYVAGSTVADALQFEIGSSSYREATAALSAAESDALLEALRGNFESHECASGVVYDVGTWIVTARRSD